VCVGGGVFHTGSLPRNKNTPLQRTNEHTPLTLLRFV